MIISFVLYLILSLFPFFFLNLTQEYFITNKYYFLAFTTLFLLLVSTIQLLISKRISWKKQLLDNPILLFLLAMVISIIFSSPNKIQAILNPNFGLVIMISLTILYFYISRNNETMKQWNNVMIFSSLFLSILTIVFFFQPLKNVVLPQNLAFLKSPNFTPVGNQLDLAILLGFFVIFGLAHIFQKRINTDKQSSNETMKQLIFNSSFLILNLLALFLAIYSIVKPGTSSPTLVLPPFRLSWFAALEILKNPQTALVGAGLDNFGSIFTRVKDFAYNQSPLWKANLFNLSRSSILQILTETGILGLLAFGWLIFSALKNIVRQLNNETMKPLFFIFLYLIICLFVFPPSLIIWFLFFVTLGLMWNNETMKQSIDLSNLIFICFGIVIISFALIGTSGYFLGRSYASEYYFKQSLNGVGENNFKKVYENQRQAIIQNPFIEKYRGNFSQTNLFVANNLAQKDQKKITEQDRQTIAQAIQAAISEGKAVIYLNPQRAEGWQNLASIYLNVINSVKDADVWTISAYQRAIILDPQNPDYRISLGKVYYSLEKYDEAVNFFRQAVELKPDYPNAQYNYAWTSFKRKDYSQAVLSMQNVLNLLDQKTNTTDYEKARKDLEEFKKILSKY